MPFMTFDERFLINIFYLKKTRSYLEKITVSCYNLIKGRQGDHT